MKKGIHPEYYPQAKVICACGNTFTTGSTREVIRTDVCSACHPFFTGEQRIVDTAGQVERFMKRLEKKEELAAEASVQAAKEAVSPQVEAAGKTQARKTAAPRTAGKPAVEKKKTGQQAAPRAPRTPRAATKKPAAKASRPGKASASEK